MDFLSVDDLVARVGRCERRRLLAHELLNTSAPAAGLMREEEPSARNCQLCSLSFRLATMIWSSTCSWTVGLRIGQMTSTREGPVF